MAASRSSRFFAFLLVSLIAAFVLAVTAAPAHAAIVAGQADGGASITSPDNNEKYDYGKSVTVKARAYYQKIDGTQPNYIYLKITKNGERVEYRSQGFKSALGLGLLPSTIEFSFTPPAEGAYFLEVHHDWTYVNGEHVELAYENFPSTADDKKTIIVQKSLKNAEVSGLDGMVYTGQALTPVPVVTVSDSENNKKTLDPETDFDVTYTKNTDAGEATATIKGKGFYKDSVTAKFNIAQADIAQATMNGVVDKTYTGSAITQTPTIIWNGRQLIAGTDYDLSHNANTDAGTATVTATGKGNFTGTLSKTFTINKASIRDASEPVIEDKTYTGFPFSQSLDLKFGGRTLVPNTDYKVAYQNNTNPGTATVTITGEGNFKDSMTRTFSIFAAAESPSGDVVILSPESGLTYTPGSTIPVKVKVNKFELPQFNGQPVKDVPNFIYARVFRNENPYETVQKSYTKAGVELDLNVPAEDAGVYEIQACWITWTFEAVQEDGRWALNYVKPGFWDFEPSDSIMAYVGVSAPSGNNVSSATVSGVSQREYTGNAITQNPTVTLGGKRLANGTDYYVTYANNVNVGTVEMTIHGTGNYKGSHISTFAITPKQVTSSMISLTPASFTYTGQVQKPEVTVMHGSIRLNQDVDYTLTNEGGTEPGDYAVEVTGKGNYQGTATKSYAINKWPIKSAVVTCDPATYTYDGQAKEPAVTAMLDGTVIPPEVYDVSYSKNTDAGTATATITAKADSYYTGSASGTFTINPLSIASSTISVSLPNNLVYNRQAQTPTPQVMLGEKPLSNETDFTLSYENNVNAGTAAKVIITGKGNFKNSRTETFAIGKKNISDQTITVDAIPDQCFIEGQPSTPQITVKDGVFQLANDVDYKVEKYENNSAIGTATITISGWGNYTGTKDDITFTICNRNEFVGTLSTAIEQVENEGINQYLAEDNAIVQAALDEANNLVNNDASTPEQLQNALDALNTAVATAKLNLAKKNLSDAADAVDKEGTSQYLDADKAAVQAALANIQALLTDDAATVEALEQALSELNSVVSTAKTNLSEAQAAQAYERAKAEALAIPSAEVIVKAIMVQKKDADPAGSKFAPLMLKSSKQSKKYNVLAWSKVAGASYYEVYGNKCGSANKLAKIASVKTNTFTHKGLKKNTYYKYVVIAIKDTVVGPRALAVSKMIHVATKGGKAKNTKKLTVKAKVGKKLKKVKSTKVKRGKTLKLKVTPSPTSGVKKHVTVRFESSDTKVATVSAKGVVKGIGAGTCFVYAYAQNGICTKVKVQIA